MRSFNKEGFSNLEDLAEVLEGLLQCVLVAKDSAKITELQNSIMIRKLNVNFLNGYMKSEIEYTVGLKEYNNNDEETTFREAT